MGSWLSDSLVTEGFKINEAIFGIPNSVRKHLQLEGPEPLYYVCLSVCLPVTHAVSGVRGADEQQKTNVRPTYSVYVFNDFSSGQLCRPRPDDCPTLVVKFKNTKMSFRTHV